MVLAVRRADVVVLELDPNRAPNNGERVRVSSYKNDVGNANGPTTIVVPSTTSFDEQLYPFEVLVSVKECVFRDDSVALCSQIRTVSIDHRITENLGSIPHGRMDEVDTALEYSLGLSEI